MENPYKCEERSSATVGATSGKFIEGYNEEPRFEYLTGNANQIPTENPITSDNLVNFQVSLANNDEHTEEYFSSTTRNDMNLQDMNPNTSIVSHAALLNNNFENGSMPFVSIESMNSADFFCK